MDTYKVRRVYDSPDDSDGTRVLVDRLWPRGLSKEDAAVEEWLKDIAPSSALRSWYHKDASRYEEFTSRYRKELNDAEHREAVDRILELAREGTVTLVTSVKDIERSHLPTLLARLEEG
jgi:uncharacterized protein YeaO (DUF488 family)